MLSFNIYWKLNVGFHINVNKNELDFCREFLSIMMTKDMCELLQYGSCTVSEDKKQELWNLLCRRLDGFTLPEPEEISVRRVL